MAFYDRLSNGQRVGIVATLVLALTLFGVMCSASININPCKPEVYWRDIGVLTFGVVCGWMMGTIASPAATSEWERFAKFGTIIGTFLSGYVLSKASSLIQLILTPAEWQAHGALSFRVLHVANRFDSVDNDRVCTPILPIAAH